MWHIHSNLKKNLFLNRSTNESTDPFGYNGFPVLYCPVQYNKIQYNGVQYRIILCPVLPEAWRFDVSCYGGSIEIGARQGY
jgi:hypothetical protein